MAIMDGRDLESVRWSGLEMGGERRVYRAKLTIASDVEGLAS
jgi:hypothetical protein